MKRKAILLTGFFLATKAFSWGADGHEIINELAVTYLGAQAPSFLKQNVAALESMATVPDRVWKSTATKAVEGPLHFFQWDHYQETELASAMPLAYSEAETILSNSELSENGQAVWRAGQLYTLLRQAINGGKCQQVLQIAGTMGHYFADLSQPMHVTADYDGQSIGKPGVHSNFETKIVQKLKDGTLRQDILKEIKNGISGLKLAANPDEVAIVGLAWAEAKISLQYLAPILAIYENGSVGNAQQWPKLTPLVAPAMARGVYTLAQVWKAAFEGKAKQLAACNGAVASLPTPSWIAFP